jgi:hypothetical protein
MIYFYRGREAGNTDTETLSEKDKMLEAKEAEVCTILYLPSTLSGVKKSISDHYWSQKNF